MEKDMRAEIIFLMEQFCEFRNILDKSLKIEIFDEGFIVKNSYGKYEKWNFYNIDIFLEKYLPYEVIENYNVEISNIDFKKGKKEELVKIYGERVYAKQALREVKKELLDIRRLLEIDLENRYLIRCKKESFNIEKFLSDYINEKCYGVISIVKGKVISLYKSKEKIIKELSWIKENNEKRSLEIIILSNEAASYTRKTKKVISYAWSVRISAQLLQVNIVAYDKESGNIDRDIFLINKKYLEIKLNKYII